MRMWLGTLKMCTAMAPPEQRECILTYSGLKSSLAVTILSTLVQRTVMMSEVLRGVDEYFLIGRGVVWTGLPLYTEEDVDSSVEW